MARWKVDCPSDAFQGQQYSALELVGWWGA